MVVSRRQKEFRGNNKGILGGGSAVPLSRGTIS